MNKSIRVGQVENTRKCTIVQKSKLKVFIPSAANEIQKSKLESIESVGRQMKNKIRAPKLFEVHETSGQQNQDL